VPANQDLILFTDGFPCVKQGEEFIERELFFLAEKFEHIIIYVLKPDEVVRTIPSNVEVRSLTADKTIRVKKIVFQNIFEITSIILNDLVHSRSRKSIFHDARFYFNVLIGNYILSETLKRQLEKDIKKSKVYYSYWCGPWFDILMLLPKSYSNKVVFRAHAYDFNVDERPLKTIPYRNYLIKKNPFISFISEFGYSIYDKEYPEYKNKKMYRLGVEKQNVLNPEGNAAEIVVVSCSTLIKQKRVELIVSILKHITIDIKWVHFGTGPLIHDVENSIKENLGSNITVELKGYVSNREILEYYRNNHVDLVMNVSELEGIPVSLMEAISFGIPVTGCKICGVPEIVTPDTGFLLDKNFDPMETARQIENYLEKTHVEKQRLRESAHQHWEKNFNADKNYRAFIKDCLLN
jgi:colanic acid/amylovoran biosynthesis glycosyltransferase